MLSNLAVLTALVAVAIARPEARNVFEIDITPEEAQKFLNSPPFTEPQLAGRTGVLPLVRYDSPSFRAAEAGPTLGHYWKNGHEIENTEDYVEEVYDASQFHGQDGLGAYAYGYRTPESSKVENREHSGDVRGSYTYKSGNDDIKIQYWADNEGFHQVDNLPKVELQPAQESEDVRQARLAHEKAWQEAAAAAAENPDPQYVYKQQAMLNQQYQQERQFQQQHLQQQKLHMQFLQQQARGEYDPAKYEYEGKQSQPQGAYASASHQQGPYGQPTPQYYGAAKQGSYGPAPQQGSYRASSQQGSYQSSSQGSYGAASETQAQFAVAPQSSGSYNAAGAGPHQGSASESHGDSQQGSYAAASEPQGQQVKAPAVGSQPAASEQREGKAYSSAQSSYQSSQQFGKYGQQPPPFGQGQQYGQSNQFQQSGSYEKQKGQQHSQDKYEEPEPTGPPRGFFYSFDYPVSIITRKDAQGQNGPVNPGHPVDHDTVQHG